MKKFYLNFTIIFFSFFACQSPKTAKTIDSDSIRINQIGYYPGSVKQFAVVDIEATKFDVVDTTNQVVFSGELKAVR